MTHSKNATHRHYQQLQSYERGQIGSFYKLCIPVPKIADLIGHNASTVYCELKRGTTTQIDSRRHCAYTTYFADTGEAVYREHRSHFVWKGLFAKCGFFIELLTKALRSKPRLHSADTFVHWFRQNYPSYPCPSTPTVYRYIECHLFSLRNQDLPIKLRRRVKHAGKHHSKINKKYWVNQSNCAQPALKNELSLYIGSVVLMKTLIAYFENSFQKESHSKTFPLLMFKRFNTHLITVQESA